MLYFRFPKLSEINYLFLDENIKSNYQNLFKKIIKSQLMKDVMNVDNEAKQFEYPFDNDLLYNEIEKICYYVVFPVENYSGISDRVSFNIYINSVINPINYKQLFIDIDHITKAKFHKFIHTSRVYFCIHNSEIKLNTPKFSKKEFLKNNKKVKYLNMI